MSYSLTSLKLVVQEIVYRGVYRGEYQGGYSEFRLWLIWMLKVAIVVAISYTFKSELSAPHGYNRVEDLHTNIC